MARYLKLKSGRTIKVSKSYRVTPGTGASIVSKPSKTTVKVTSRTTPQMGITRISDGKVIQKAKSSRRTSRTIQVKAPEPTVSQDITFIKTKPKQPISKILPGVKEKTPQQKAIEKAKREGELRLSKAPRQQLIESRIKSIARKVGEDRRLGKIRTSAGKKLETVRDIIIKQSKGLDPKEKSKRAKILKGLESGSLSISGDNLVKGLGVGTTQILSNPARYYAKEEIQDLIDIITRPVKTIKETAAFVKATPLTYVGEVGAEMIFFGAAEKGIKKYVKTGDKVVKGAKATAKYLSSKSKKFVKGAGKEFAKLYSLKGGVKKVGGKLITKVGGKFIPVVGQVSLGADVIKIVRAGYLATIPIKKGETKKDYNTRIDKKVTKDISKLKKDKVIPKTINISSILGKAPPSKKETKALDKIDKKTKEIKGLQNKVKTTKNKTQKKKFKNLIKLKKAQVTKLKLDIKIKKKEKKKQKTQVKKKPKKKLTQKQKQKQKKKEKQKLKEKEKAKEKEKKKEKEKQKQKLKIKGKIKKKPTTTKKAKVSLSKGKGKPSKKKTVKQAKKEAENYLLKKPGLQNAKITSSKNIKKVVSKKPNIKYKVSKGKKVLTLKETKKTSVKKKVTKKPTIKKKVTKKPKTKKKVTKKPNVKKKVIKKSTVKKKSVNKKSSKTVKKVSKPSTKKKSSKKSSKKKKAPKKKKTVKKKGKKK